MNTIDFDLTAGSTAALLQAAPNASIRGEDRERASTDRSGYLPPSPPDGVVFARSADDVVQTLRLASRHRVPVVPRGAGTGLAAASASRAGEVVLDVSGMNEILRIDPVEQLAVVQPGVLNAELNAAAAGYGLFYAPDPASTAICSIGGNIATNAGGMRCQIWSDPGIGAVAAGHPRRRPRAAHRPGHHQGSHRV